MKQAKFNALEGVASATQVSDIENQINNIEDQITDIEEAMASLGEPFSVTIATVADVANFHPTIAPDIINTAGYSAVGDNGGALYKRVASEPSHAGKFSIALSGGGTAWYEIAENTIRLQMLGGMPSANCIAAMDAALAIGPERIIVPNGATLGRHEINATELTIEGGRNVVFSNVAAAGFWAGACGTLEICNFIDAVLPAYPDTGGVIADGAVFFGLLPGANITNLYIRDNLVSGGRMGISAGFENGRTLGRKCVIERNVCSDQNGGLGGEGYGIHWANENNSGEGFILNNKVIRSGRHAFYFARNLRAQVIFSGNSAFDHRQNSTTKDVQVRAAIQISRSKNIVGFGNTVDGFYDSALWVIEDDANVIDADNVRLFGTSIRNQKNVTPAIYMGYSTPANNCRIRGVLLDGLTYEPNLNGAQLFNYVWGLAVTLRNVTIIYRGTTGAAGVTRMFLLQGNTVGNTQALFIENVTIHLIGATGTYSIMRPIAPFATSQMSLRVSNVRVVENTGGATVNNWEPSVAITNTSIEASWFPMP